MNTIVILLFAATLAVASSSTLRGLSISSQEQHHPSSRRHLTQGTRCTIFLSDVDYGVTPEHPEGYSEDEWICQLPQDEATQLGVEFVSIAEPREEVKRAKSGQSMMDVSEAIIDTFTSRMYIPNEASVAMTDYGVIDNSKFDFDKREYDTTDYDAGGYAARDPEPRDSKFRRNLAAKKGTLNTLVLRVIDSRNVGPTKDANQISSDVFNDAVCLKSQMNACSYGQLKIEPYKGNGINNGVLDVKIDFSADGRIRSDVGNEAINQARKIVGNLDDSKFGLIMVCMPPGTQGNWVAYAFTGGKYSFYNNEWCSSVSAQLHEVGHNLGLSHSGQEGEGTYNDQSGMMGFSYNDDDGPQMCYNPAKSYQLGWYNEQIRTINPLSKPSQQVTLNGVADYRKNKNSLVVLRLEQTNREQDYYIGYNRKTGINQKTVEDGDRVTIVRKESGGPTESGTSMKVASLDGGKTYTIKNFNGQRDVEIAFRGINNGNALIEILDKQNAPNTPPPPCTEYRVEVKTDKYPGDTSWEFIQENQFQTIVATSPQYTQQEKTITTKVCLEYSKNYIFRLKDGYGDGLCCDQGSGYVKVYDNKGNPFIRLEGKNAFDTFERKFSIGNNPNPTPSTKSPTKPPTKPPTKRPTKRPTKPPTKPPTKRPVQSPMKAPPNSPPSDSSGCAKYVVKVKTDNFPKDNKWKFVDEKGRVLATSKEYSVSEKTYEDQVCLPLQSKVTFVFEDIFGDGICCGQGSGAFSLTDTRGKKITTSKDKKGSFQKIEREFNVGSKNDVCKDKTETFVAKKRWGKKSCQWFAKNKKCNSKIKGQKKRVWALCPSACNRCKL